MPRAKSNGKPGSSSQKGSARQLIRQLRQSTRRRYRRRWKIERTIAWLHNFRRLVVRYDYYSNVYQAFILMACIQICLRKF